jgi:hypothetical protein
MCGERGRSKIKGVPQFEQKLRVVLDALSS